VGGWVGGWWQDGLGPCATPGVLLQARLYQARALAFGRLKAGPWPQGGAGNVGLLYFSPPGARGGETCAGPVALGGRRAGPRALLFPGGARNGVCPVRRHGHVAWAGVDAAPRHGGPCRAGSAWVI
jgi:hypothetical protein